MTSRIENRPWDFSNVLELVNSLSLPNNEPEKATTLVDTGEALEAPRSTTLPINGRTAKNDFTSPSKLGDFGKIWEFLGSPTDTPASTHSTPSSEPPQTPSFTSKIDYTSDGAIYTKTAVSATKTVTWKEPVSADELASQTLSDRPVSPGSPTLTKTQRKKLRRKERKAAEAAELLKQATVSESEADIVRQKAPARKASVHALPVTPAKRHNIRERDDFVRKITSDPLISEPESEPEPTIALAVARVAEKLAELKASPPKTPRRGQQCDTNPSPYSNPTTQSYSSKRSGRSNLLAGPSTQLANASVLPRTTSAVHAGPQDDLSQWPVTRSNATTTLFTPSSVQPPPRITARAATQAPAHASPSTASKPKYVIEPKIIRTGEDRHWALMLKLIGDFPADVKHMVAPANLTTHNNHPNGIHVFVDASNIFIGFTDQLKRARNIPLSAQVPQVDLSFDALTLLMERRRPVAKRVLVGSTPYVPAFDVAKAVGYECSILEKVYKARELTERQIFFKERDRYGRPRSRSNGVKASSSAGNSGPSSLTALNNGATHNGANGNGNGNGSGSGSETGNASPQFAPARMIEQGVDEILHMKILESIVDQDTPSTIVLATGDAAQAEYSPGFKVNVERALNKGWRIELVSWSRNISQMYMRREWQAKWGERFRVIYLDDYAEELLEM